MADVPHLAFPLRVVGGRLAQVEQNSVDDVAQSVELLLLARPGERVDVPGYGLEDLSFLVTLPLAAARATIERFEPRASVVLTERPDMWDVLVRRVAADVRGGA